MSGADPLGASRARGAGPGYELALGAVVTAVEYDVVGERGGRYAQVRSGIATVEEVRAEVEAFTGVNPDITWHVIARTTTSETPADHLIDALGHQERPTRAATRSSSTSSLT